MKLRVRDLVCVGLLGLMIVGCGGGTTGDNPIEVEVKEVPAKAMLQEVASSGQLGSASMEIRDALEAMKSSGEASADGLLKDLEELEKMSSPAQITKKAQEMAGKL